LPVTAVDLLPHRLQVIAAVQRGGLDNLTCARMDATRLAFPDASFDVVTLLETLEHIPDAASAVAEVTRVARRFVLLSVPSQADDNPEHLHLFSQESLRALFAAAGIARLKFSYVPKHLLVVATKEP
jgi:ubiquinone/menaquinone biosynthesis C-methylase UbiE